MLAICALTPVVASAAITNPPGATEGDQYFEEVPNGGGSNGANHAGGGSGSGSQSVAGTQALDQLGADGKQAAAVANANRPPEQVKPAHGSASQDGSPANAPGTAPTDGDGGMGFWFPLLLVLTALAAIAYGLRRRLHTA